MRQSQEAVELALKAALRVVGVEPPKWHDVSPVLLESRGRFPKWFDEKIDELASTSRWLRREREPSMYGDEESGLPPQKLYTKIYAERVLNEARNTVKLVHRLVREGLNK
ncbi:MAG: HEPN domain-containing protein [Candidatus Jordarchaeales archaeon]